PGQISEPGAGRSAGCSADQRPIAKTSDGDQAKRLDQPAKAIHAGATPEKMSTQDDLARQGSPQEEDPGNRITSVQPDGTRRLRHCTLPTGMEIMCQSRAEVDYFYADIFEKQTYFRHGVVLRDGDCVFDVGANIGLFTLFVHSRYKNIDFYAFEPS